MNYIKIKSWRFLKEVKTLDIDNIELFIKKRNYTIKYFKSNDERVIGLCPDAVTKKGFVYRSDALRIVYIFSEMSVKEKIETLVHEAGHILLDNDIDSISFKGAKATMFSEYVFRALNNDKAKFNIWKFGTIAATILIAAAMFFTGNQIYKKQAIKTEKNISNSIVHATNATTDAVQPKSDKVYKTPTGKKYHTYDCRYVNIATATEIAFDEIENYNLDPCKVCRPDKQ